MMKSINYLSFLLLALATSCNSQINSFVDGAVHPPLPTVVLNNPSSDAMKLSPGSIQSSGTSVKATMAITPTNRNLKGSQVQATISLSQGRMN